MSGCDVDGVMTFIADDAVFNNAPPSGATLSDREAIRQWIQRQVDTGTMAELSNIQVNGDTVAWEVKLSRTGAPFATDAPQAVVQDGKVKVWTFK